MGKNLLIVLLVLRFFILACVIISLVLCCLVPQDLFSTFIDSRWKISRIAGIVIFSAACLASLVSMVLQGINLFLYPETRFFTLFINVVDLIAGFAVIGISIPLICAEVVFDDVDYLYARKYFFLVSGIMGIVAVAGYMLDLLISRCFQFTVYDARYEIDNNIDCDETCDKSCHNHCENRCHNNCETKKCCDCNYE